MRATTRPGSETTDLRVGDKVRAHRETVSRGAQWRYEGREGWVAAVNRQIFPSGTTYVEIGVTWAAPSERNPSVDLWFRADELTKT